tara:strand:+ start:1166 stop:2533 length:1368 start_codon:yes stop_codon:yes gene_type:complete
MNARFILCAVKLLIVALVLPLKGNTQEIEKPLENSSSILPAYSQIFKENVQIAVAEHPRTAAAVAARDKMRFEEDEARAGLYPQVYVDLTGRQRVADNFEERFDNITQRSLRDTAANISLVGRQLLYDGGTTSSRISAARYAFTAAHEEYSHEASSVAMAAVDSHYYVLYQRLRREIHQKNITRHREILNMVQEKFNSGRGTNQDVTLMQSRLAIVETSAARVNMDLEEAISHYEEIYSFAPGEVRRPDVSMDLPITENEALQLGFQNNSLLTMASSRSLSSRENMNAAKGELFPQFSVELSATKYDLERGNPDYDVTGRILVNYNLYSGGASSARIAQSLKNYENVKYTQDNIMREVDRTIKVAFQNKQSQEKQIIFLKRASEASKINRDQTREQFEATGGSLFSLLEAEREHHSAQEQYSGGIVEFELAKYRLLNSMGTLLGTLNILLNREER